MASESQKKQRMLMIDWESVMLASQTQKKFWPLSHRNNYIQKKVHHWNYTPRRGMISLRRMSSGDVKENYYQPIGYCNNIYSPNSTERLHVLFYLLWIRRSWHKDDSDFYIFCRISLQAHAIIVFCEALLSVFTMLFIVIRFTQTRDTNVKK